jgi:hypothetical protein
MRFLPSYTSKNTLRKYDKIIEADTHKGSAPHETSRFTTTTEDVAITATEWKKRLLHRKRRFPARYVHTLHLIYLQKRINIWEFLS